MGHNTLNGAYTNATNYLTELSVQSSQTLHSVSVKAEATFSNTLEYLRSLPPKQLAVTASAAVISAITLTYLAGSTVLPNPKNSTELDNSTKFDTPPPFYPDSYLDGLENLKQSQTPDFNNTPPYYPDSYLNGQAYANAQEDIQLPKLDIEQPLESIATNFSSHARVDKQPVNPAPLEKITTSAQEVHSTANTKSGQEAPTQPKAGKVEQRDEAATQTEKFPIVQEDYLKGEPTYTNSTAFSETKPSMNTDTPDVDLTTQKPPAPQTRISHTKVDAGIASIFTNYCTAEFKPTPSVSPPTGSTPSPQPAPQTTTDRTPIPQPVPQTTTDRTPIPQPVTEEKTETTQELRDRICKAILTNDSSGRFHTEIAEVCTALLNFEKSTSNELINFAGTPLENMNTVGIVIKWLVEGGDKAICPSANAFFNSQIKNSELGKTTMREVFLRTSQNGGKALPTRLDKFCKS